ncbi:MAG: hypothetical protein UX59_C0004G0013 [Microgenomates group bacterium GW2011_GWA1_46_7]|nr:MAG: hypothetical protein UX59_C0004G0013 [Microgenomates group bacterium GW2011_GWA1_46_7]
MRKIIVTTLYLLIILIPLTFTTINSELFEFPKFILLLSGTLIILAAWGYHLYRSQQSPLTLFSRPSAITLSILAILLTQTLATIFSLHPYTSFWGYYSRFHQGLLTTICYTIVYFAALKWLDYKSTQKLIKVSVITAFFISLYAVLEHFGIDKNFWIQDVQNRVFSTLGQPNWLAAYLLPHLFLTLYLFQTDSNKSRITPYYLLFSLFFVTLLFTKSRSGFLAFALSYPVYFFLLTRQFSWTKIKFRFIRLSVLLILIALAIGTPYSPRLSLNRDTNIPTTSIGTGTVLDSGGTESGDIRKIVWTGALKLIAQHPILGTGPETFAYTYYWTRPLAHNITSEWDFLYNKAHNEYLNIAATTGLLGLAAYLYFHFAIFHTSLLRVPSSKKVQHDQDDQLRNLYPVLGAAIVSFAVTNFFGFSVIPVYLLITLLAAFSTSSALAPEKCALQVSNRDMRNASKETLQTQSSLGGPAIILFTIILLYPARLWYADYVYAQGKKYQDVNQGAAALPYLLQAVSLRPGSDLYHSLLAETYASLNQKDLALSEIELNRKLNPHHLNFYKSRAKAYLSLTLTEPAYHQQAADELLAARQLAPTDPKLAYNLGLIYTRLGKLDLAEQQFQDAINLKPNYAEPYYALALLYEQDKQLSKLTPLLTQAKANLATYSALLKDKIDKYLP